MIDIDAPLDLTHPEAPAFLGAIQGNIIRGQSRDFTAHVFIQMWGPVAEVLADVGVDALIGRNQAPLAQSWPAGGPKFTMANMVQMLGGEYFLAPSMSFFCNAVPGAASGATA